jgi:hypothetical protein
MPYALSGSNGKKRHISREMFRRRILTQSTNVIYIYIYIHILFSFPNVIHVDQI